MNNRKGPDSIDSIDRIKKLPCNTYPALLAPHTHTHATQYLLIVLAFAAIYMVVAADANCGMEIGNFLEGYYFSLETMVRKICWLCMADPVIAPMIPPPTPTDRPIDGLRPSALSSNNNFKTTTNGLQH